MSVFPICLDCKHLGATVDGRMRCAAFPDGIPKPILLARANHRQPYPGDRGILFEPAPPSAEDHAPPRP